MQDICVCIYHDQINGTSNVVNMVTNTIPIISSGRPARAIFGMVTYPLAKTIALGGVPTGITNPKLVAIVRGIMSNRGSIPRETARDAEIGINNAALAVLLTISPTNIATATITKITRR
jgi:hypothetical protein